MYYPFQSSPAPPGKDPEWVFSLFGTLDERAKASEKGLAMNDTNTLNDLIAFESKKAEIIQANLIQALKTIELVSKATGRTTGGIYAAMMAISAGDKAYDQNGVELNSIESIAKAYAEGWVGSGRGLEKRRAAIAKSRSSTKIGAPKKAA